MKNIWQNLNRPIICLAPMAGWTDSAMRQICKDNGADLVYSEMISADGIYYDSIGKKNLKKSVQLAEFKNAQRPIVIQIFGNDPKKMAYAAKYIEKTFKPDGIDINMGCPARKINKNFHGASLIKDVDLATEIVKAVKGAISIPLSVKTRLGWDNPVSIFEFARKLEAAGADAIAVHGRTKSQEYSGNADWASIAKIKKQLKIPVLASGDMINPEEIVKFINSSGIDGVLIARGSMGQPWIFKKIKALLEDKKFTSLSLQQINQLVLKHAKLFLKSQDNLIEFRKHLIHYYKGIDGAKILRAKLIKVTNFEELKNTLDSNKNCALSDKLNK